MSIFFYMNFFRNVFKWQIRVSIMVIILMVIIVYRKEVVKLKHIKKWCLIYGRRKTGKTFMVQHFLKPKKYFFINRDRSIYSQELNHTISYETLQALLSEVDETALLVIYEFHRLVTEFLDFIQRIPKRGKIILISSTLMISKVFFHAKSPILGYFAEFPVSLIDLEDVLRALHPHFSERLSAAKLIELAIIGREPWTIEYFSKNTTIDIIKTILKHSLRTIPALIGEIFMEEERSLSQIYEGILRAVAANKRITTEISSHLYSRGLIKKDDPSSIQPYLHNLCQLGILKRIKDQLRNRFYYYHVSSLSELFYYADEKYAISERRVSESEWDRIISEKLPRIVEKELREALALKMGLEERIIQNTKFEVDGLLVKFKKPEIVLEIKWKNKLNHKDINNVVKNLEQVDCRKKILITKNEISPKAHASIPPDIEVVTTNNLIKMLLSFEEHNSIEKEK